MQTDRLYVIMAEALLLNESKCTVHNLLTIVIITPMVTITIANPFYNFARENFNCVLRQIKNSRKNITFLGSRKFANACGEGQ